MTAFGILISSAGRRAELAQCFRHSAEALGLSVKIVACDFEPELSAACFLADVAVPVPRCTDPTYVDALMEITEAHDIRLVVPTIDTELEPLAAARERFAQRGVRIHVSPASVVAVARDKLRTAEVLAAAGVPVPRTFAFDPGGRSNGFAFPMFLKPTGGSASRGIRIVSGRHELPPEVDEPMVLQQLLQGPEYTVNMFVDADGVLRCVVAHRRLRVRAGEVEKGRTKRDAAFTRIAAGVLSALPEARGAMCFQLIEDPNAGPCVFEINARFGGGYPLAHHAGAEFSRWLLEEVVDLPRTANDRWREGVTMLRYDAAVFDG